MKIKIMSNIFPSTGNVKMNLFILVTFLIPYFIMLIVEGIPLYYMELCIGQRLQKGTICVWHSISPYLDGVGIASAAICFLVCLYYNVILSWCLVYFINSFKDPLPWSRCPKIRKSIGKTYVGLLFNSTHLRCQKLKNNKANKISIN